MFGLGLLCTKNSFLPSTISVWNSLPDEAKLVDNISDFKMALDINKPRSNPLFYYGKRRQQVLHTRLRTNCSSLNKHLYDRNLVISPLCQCGKIEDTTHFFLICPLHANLRLTLVRTIEQYTDISLRTLLFGDDNLSFIDNLAVFDAVHSFIEGSGRFGMI